VPEFKSEGRKIGRLLSLDAMRGAGALVLAMGLAEGLPYVNHLVWFTMRAGS
jgi:hypothetical protein